MFTSEITQVNKETHDSWSLRFRKPEGFDYLPGQFCIFEHEINGQLIKRSYSLSSAPTEDFMQITVKRVPHGKMSGYLTKLHPRINLNYAGPYGKFILDEKLKEVVFIAGGSGISPFRCMLEYIFDKKLKMNATLIYGCRSPDDIILYHDLHEYNEKYKNFKLFLTIDHPADNWSHHVGYIDKDFIIEATEGKPEKKVYFICGPPLMVNSVKQTLLDMGIKDENIRLDAWG